MTDHDSSVLNNEPGVPAAPSVARGLKYIATKIDIVTDFYDLTERLNEKYAANPEALAAIDEVQSIAIWWANTPAVVTENRAAVGAPQPEPVSRPTSPNTDESK